MIASIELEELANIIYFVIGWLDLQRLFLLRMIFF